MSSELRASPVGRPRALQGWALNSHTYLSCEGSISYYLAAIMSCT